MRNTYTKGQVLKCLRIPAEHHGYFTVGREYTVVEFDYNPTDLPLRMSSDENIDLWCEASAFEDIKADGGPAFGEFQQAGDCSVKTGGMSLRDYFAAKAMLGFLSGPMNRVQFEGDADVASLSYIMADAMLAERAK